MKNLTTGLKRTEAAAVILLSLPGPKMIWQFGELGYDYELNNNRLAPKPVNEMMCLLLICLEIFAK